MYCFIIEIKLLKKKRARKNMITFDAFAYFYARAFCMFSHALYGNTCQTFTLLAEMAPNVQKQFTSILHYALPILTQGTMALNLTATWLKSALSGGSHPTKPFTIMLTWSADNLSPQYHKTAALSKITPNMESKNVRHSYYTAATHPETRAEMETSK